MRVSHDRGDDVKREHELLARRRPDAGGRSAAGSRTAVSTVDAVAGSLRQRVLDGQLPPGTHLGEVQLSETYGIARHGVRAAIHKLVHEGLLVHHAHRGAFVPEFTADAVRDLYVLRRAIELEAVRTICERRLPIEEVAARVAELARLPTDAAWSELVAHDLEIHEAIVHVVGSARMDRAYRALLGELRLCLAFLGAMPFRRMQLRSEHEQILYALAAHDLEPAVAVMRTHLELAERNTTAALATPTATDGVALTPTPT